MLWNDSQIAVQVALAQLFFVVVTLASCSRKKDTTNETSIEKDRVKAVKSVPVSPQANMSENDLKRQSSPSKGEIINDKGRAKVEKSVRVSIKANMSEDDFKGPSKEEITNDKISMAESKRPQTTQDISKTEGKEKKKKDKKVPPKPKISPGRKVEEKTSGVSITKDGIDTRLLMESTAAASNNSMKTQETKEDATNLTKLTSVSQARTSTASGSRTNKGDVDHTQNSPSSKAKLKR